MRDRLKAEFGEEVLRESGLFSWKQEEGSPSIVGRPQKSSPLGAGDQEKNPDGQVDGQRVKAPQELEKFRRARALRWQRKKEREREDGGGRGPCDGP